MKERSVHQNQNGLPRCGKSSANQLLLSESKQSITCKLCLNLMSGKPHQFINGLSKNRSRITNQLFREAIIRKQAI